MKIEFEVYGETEGDFTRERLEEVASALRQTCNLYGVINVCVEAEAVKEITVTVADPCDDEEDDDDGSDE